MRILKGTVISDAPAKSVIVKVDRVVAHPKYKKRYKISKRYLTHDEKNEYHVGDIVRIAEIKPKSAKKRYTVEALIGRVEEAIELSTAEELEAAKIRPEAEKVEVSEEKDAEKEESEEVK